MSAISGTKVLDLSRLLPGPLCTMFLADYGAEIIKIEDTNQGDYSRQVTQPIDKETGMSMRFSIINRNKKSVAIDLKSTKGKEIFLQLVKEADILLEGFRPGVMKKLGLDYETLKKYNPKLIYCSLTGYGQTGEKANEPGHDINYMSLAGALDNIGTNETPVVPGIQIADLSGAYQALVGILLALLGRYNTGKGDHIDVSMKRGLLPALVSLISYNMSGLEAPHRSRQTLGGGLARYNIYKAKDGKFLAVGALEKKFWANLCNELDLPHFIEQFDAPYETQEYMKETIQNVFLINNRDEWIEKFKEKDCCVTPVYSIEEALANNDEQYIINTEIGRQLINPIQMQDSKILYNNSAPLHGEHTCEYLKGLGYTETTIEELISEGSIKASEKVKK